MGLGCRGCERGRVLAVGVWVEPRPDGWGFGVGLGHHERRQGWQRSMFFCFLKPLFVLCSACPLVITDVVGVLQIQHRGVRLWL